MAKLFEPVQLGRLALSHRTVMPPMARMRVDDEFKPIQPSVTNYYAQRAKVPGSFLITEATVISLEGAGWNHIPEIWSDAQIAAWKEVADAVHAQGSYIFMQLVALGRTADPENLKLRGSRYGLLAPSPIAIDANSPIPREMSVEDIQDFVEMFGIAAENAVFKAGFDGVEIHGANGYLVDQFLQDVSNQRTDEYGGSPARRTKFALDVVERITRSLGQDRVGLRLSPWARCHGLGMADPKPTYTHLTKELKRRLPDLAYLHVIEPRFDGSEERSEDGYIRTDESNEFIREIWAPKILIRAGGFVRDTAIIEAEKDKQLIAMGRWYIANPDLPTRLKDNIPLTKYDRATFYLPGDRTGLGYTDYSFAHLHDYVVRA